MAVITSKNEKMRREAKKETEFLKARLIASPFTYEDAADWLGCTVTNLYKILKSGGIKYWQARVIEKHLEGD